MIPGSGMKDMYLLHHEENRISGIEYSGDQENPFLYDIWPELSDTLEMSGKCRDDIH